MIATGLVAVPSPTPSFGADAPHVLHGPVADVVVRVEGAAVCSGTPITGSVFVVTAAHCVLRRSGEVAPVSVVRDGVRYEAAAILVDTRYRQTPVPALDAAVLVMDRVIPGPSAMLGDVVPKEGVTTLAGLQRVDVHGALVRGDRPHDRSAFVGFGDGATAPAAAKRVPAGCTEPAAALDMSDESVVVHCGLIPGSSGGGLFTDDAGTTTDNVTHEITLVGIISTVANDRSYNRIVPLDSLHRLLGDPGAFEHTPSMPLWGESPARLS